MKLSINEEKDGGTSGKEPTCQGRRRKRHGFSSWVRKIFWKRKWQPTLVFLPEKSHGQRRLAGCSPWGCKELDTIEHPLHQILIEPDYVANTMPDIKNRKMKKTWSVIEVDKHIHRQLWFRMVSHTMGKQRHWIYYP